MVRPSFGAAASHYCSNAMRTIRWVRREGTKEADMHGNWFSTPYWGPICQGCKRSSGFGSTWSPTKWGAAGWFQRQSWWWSRERLPLGRRSQPPPLHSFAPGVGAGRCKVGQEKSEEAGQGGAGEAGQRRRGVDAGEGRVEASAAEAGRRPCG
jgi:hypothetical protein